MSFATEYEQFVHRIQKDADWVGPPPTTDCTLKEYVEDHRGLIPFVDYGGRRRWDGFHTASHPAPSLSEPGDWAADRILMKYKSKSPRRVGENTPNFPSRKLSSPFDGFTHKERIKHKKTGRNRAAKRVMKAVLVDGLSHEEAARKFKLSEMTARRILAAKAPEVLVEEKTRRSAQRRENSKWGWLKEKLRVAPHTATFYCVGAPHVATKLRSLLAHEQEFVFSVKCVSATTIAVKGEPRPIPAWRLPANGAVCVPQSQPDGENIADASGFEGGKP